MPDNRNAARWVLSSVSALRAQIGTLIGLLLAAAFVIFSIFSDPSDTRWFVTFVVLSLMAICSWLIGERIIGARQVVQVAAPQLVDAVQGAVKEGLAQEGPVFLENERRVLETAIDVIHRAKRGRGPHSSTERVRATSLFMSSDISSPIREIKSKYFEAVAELCKLGNYRYHVVMTSESIDELKKELGMRKEAFDMKYGAEGWKTGTEFVPRYVEYRSGLEVLVVADHVLFNIMRAPGDRPERAGVYLRHRQIAGALRQWYDETLLPTTSESFSPKGT